MSIDRVEDEHASRHDHLHLQHHETERNQQRAEARGENDPLQVEKAREAPEAAIEAERDEDGALQRQDPHERAADVGDERLAKLEAVAKPVQRGPGERCDAEVVDESEPRPEILRVLHSLF